MMTKIFETVWKGKTHLIADNHRLIKIIWNHSREGTNQSSRQIAEL